MKGVTQLAVASVLLSLVIGGFLAATYTVSADRAEIQGGNLDYNGDTDTGYETCGIGGCKATCGCGCGGNPDFCGCGG